VNEITVYDYWIGHEHFPFCNLLKPSQGFLDFLKNVRYAQERTAREPSCCVGTRADQGTGTGLDAGEIVPTAGVDADCVAHIDE